VELSVAASWPVSQSDMQSKLGSATEAVTNVLVGFGLALTAQMVLFPLAGVQIPISTHLGLSAVFTVLSLARSYLLRRAFNTWHG